MTEKNPGEEVKPLQHEDNLTPNDFITHLQTPTSGRRVLVSKVFLDQETTVFEVKVVSKHISEEDVYEETEVINCHVCDEAIPRGYFREHAQSAVHQNKKKISEMFLEGLLNDTKLLRTNHVSNMLHDSYYCSPCIKLVPSDQVLAHGLSVEHLKAIDRETALNVFVKKYIDTEPQPQQPLSVIANPVDNMFCREISEGWTHNLVGDKLYCFGIERAQVNENESSVTENTTVNQVSYIECKICDSKMLKTNYLQHVQGKNHRKNQNKIEIQAASSLQTQKKQQPLPSTSRDDRNVQHFRVYLKKMVSKYNLKYKLPFVKDGGLLVVTPHGFVAVVTVESFHGYVPTQSSIYCQLCEMTISTDTRVHSETRNHVKHITQQIDEYFTRKISVVMSHCVLCNTIVLDAAEHSATDPQHNSYMQARVSCCKPVESSDKKRKLIFCDVCNIYLTPNTYQDHIKGQRHLKSMSKRCEQQETPANMVYCDVCTRTIHCNNFQEHCKGKRHIVYAKRSRRKSQADVVRSSPTAVNSNASNFLEYLMLMITKYNLKCTLPEVEHDGVVIKTPKGCREKFSFEVFHSYKQAESSVVCQVCRMNVLSKDATVHSLTKPHVVNILQPVDDNFSRKINKSWNHCLVCNITVLNSFDHASYSPIHKNINGPVSRPRAGSDDGNAEKIFCSGICG